MLMGIDIQSYNKTEAAILKNNKAQSKNYHADDLQLF